MSVDKSVLDNKEYDFLRDDPRLGNNIVMLGVWGSHGIGTNTATSDVDIRGIATNTAETLLLGGDFDNVVDKQTDTVIYSFDKILSLFASCNPSTIDLLGLSDEDYLYVGPVGRTLIDNPQWFLSKKAAATYSGYATQQLYKLQQKTLYALSDEEYQGHIAEVLNGMRDTFHMHYGIDPDALNVRVADGELRFDFDIKDISAEKLLTISSEIENTLKNYNKVSHRNENAISKGKLNKHAMHLIRLYLMAYDILENHIIITKRDKEHDLLMAIKNGEFMGEDGKPNKEFFDMVAMHKERLKAAVARSTLPDGPDLESIERFRMKVNSDIIARWREDNF